jgi:hypothetical protein
MALIKAATAANVAELAAVGISSAYLRELAKPTSWARAVTLKIAGEKVAALEAARR